MHQVIVRPLIGSLRCAACHDDLPGRRFTCPGCRVVLHRDCRAELARCPTVGCTVTLGGRVAPPARRTQPRRRGALFHLVWLVPGLLAFLWPVWYGLLGVGNPLAMLLSFVLGPAIGHCLALVASANDDPGSPHLRAFVAEGAGFAASVPALFVFVVVLLARAWG